MKYDFLAKMNPQSGPRIFSSEELRRETGASVNAVRLWLIRQIKKGTVIPLKRRRGLYASASALPHEWAAANRLYQPSYISLETALSYYGLLLESVYPVTSVTTRTSRTFHAMGKEFAYQKIKKTAFGGTRALPIEGQTVLIAEKEKALADYLYLASLGEKKLNERLRWGKVRWRKVEEYLSLFERPKLISWSRDVIQRND